MSNQNSKVYEYINKFIADYGHSFSIESTIRETSFNSAENNYLCTSNIEVIDCDLLTKKCYRKVIKPTSESENDSNKSVDAILLVGDYKIYLIEFKDANIKSHLKKDIRIKAYSTVCEVVDIICLSGGAEDLFEEYGYNPLEFIRNRVCYILVYSTAKNANDYIQENNCRLKNEKYVPEGMKKLQGYLFKEAFAMSELTFENDFLKSVFREEYQIQEKRITKE